MRAYYFGNMYLSSIQQGIQALHCTSQMYLKYEVDSSLCMSNLRDWGENHKTVVLLNGGESAALCGIARNFGTVGNPYPHAYFEEGIPDLNGAMTCVGIVLPEYIYGVADELRRTPFSKREALVARKQLSTFETYVVTLITESGLAR